VQKLGLPRLDPHISSSVGTHVDPHHGRLFDPYGHVRRVDPDTDRLRRLDISHALRIDEEGPLPDLEQDLSAVPLLRPQGQDVHGRVPVDPNEQAVAGRQLDSTGLRVQAVALRQDVVEAGRLLQAVSPYDPGAPVQVLNP